MSSSPTFCDTDSYIYSPKYTSWTDWSNCTSGDCFGENTTYRIPYESWCGPTDTLGNLSFTTSTDRKCCMKTANVETRPCEAGVWNCTLTVEDLYNDTLISWTPWQSSETCTSNSHYRIGWDVKYSNVTQLVEFFYEAGPQGNCPDTTTEWNSDWIYYICGLLFVALVLTFIVVSKILHRRHKRRENGRNRLRSRIQRGQNSVSASGVTYLPPAYTAISPRNTVESGGQSTTLQSSPTTINTISLPPTYDEAVLSDNGSFVAIPRSPTPTLTPTTTSAVNPISLFSTNALLTGIPPPCYDLLFNTGPCSFSVPDNERPPPYAFSQQMNSTAALY